MKKKMQINKKKEERRGTQERMSKVEKTARPENAEKPIKATRPENAEKPIKSAERADAVCPYAKKCGGCDYQGMPYEKQLKEKQAYVQKQVGNFCKVLPILAAVPEPVETVKLQMESRETEKTEDLRQSRHRVGLFRVYTKRERMRSSISMPVRSRMNCPVRSSVTSGGFCILLKSRHTMRTPVTVCCVMCWCGADSTVVR